MFEEEKGETRESFGEIQAKIDLWLLKTFQNLKKEKEFFETKEDTQKVELLNAKISDLEAI